ncbi:uncharacterized protein IL334_006081 [Kwoniella shivajii]|uniref:Uncharacterized protein n=1 Tax=Kwoniella shivajii TaxID=564305 RepID=A0ABZ1D4X5_9TREE|nr:hypothetical protein IL334_006081 [Kwoniella shivajii]
MDEILAPVAGPSDEHIPRSGIPKIENEDENERYAIIGSDLSTRLKYMTNQITLNDLYMMIPIPSSILVRSFRNPLKAKSTPDRENNEVRLCTPRYLTLMSTDHDAPS